MLGEIQKFLSGCPFLSDRKLNINYLGSDIGDCAVMRSRDDETVRAYADGGRLMAAHLRLLIREPYLKPLSGNLSSGELCENISGWLSMQNRRHSLPDLGESAEAFSLETVGYGIDSAGYADACFYVSFKLTYYSN